MTMMESVNDGGASSEGLVLPRLDLNQNPRRCVPSLAEHDVSVQRQLGSGAFCTVFSFKSSPSASLPMLAEDFADTSDQDFTSVCSESSSEDDDLVRSTKPSRSSQVYTCCHFALKRLREDFPINLNARKVAVEDFLLEAELLSRLPEHPNIIKLVALSQDFQQSPEDGFIVLERLEESLDQRLAIWKTKSSVHRGGLLASKIWCRSSRRRALEQDQRHRIEACALGLSKALEHLHKHDIIYRDLKPSNIGFAADGSVRLFDFGLARSCKETNRHLTGDTGTARYMAPEVALHQPYDLSADVYSFGLILWQLCSLEKPFARNTSRDKWFQAAVKRHQRPSLRPVMSDTVRELIKVCWDPNPATRPSSVLVSHQVKIAVTQGDY